MSTAYLLARVDYWTGQITGYGIYSERMPTTVSADTWFEVHTVTRATYEEALGTLLSFIDAMTDATYEHTLAPLYRRIQKDVGKPR